MQSKEGILLIETATRVCSVAYSLKGELLAQRISSEAGANHAVQLAPFVQEVLTEAQAQGFAPEAIAVSAGPGSYTGLRIGASTAKGLAFGFEIPLIVVPTLQIEAAAAIPYNTQNLRIRSMIDARRMEVYTAMYDTDLRPLSDERAEVLTPKSFESDFALGPVLLVGDGAAKSKEIFTHPHAVFCDQEIAPTAMAMARLAQSKMEQRDFADLAYWEPDYLKEYVAVVGQNKVLNNITKTV